MAGLNLILTLNTERYAQVKTTIQWKTHTRCSTEVPDWSAAEPAQKEQESQAETTREPTKQSQVIKVPENLEQL